MSGNRLDVLSVGEALIDLLAPDAPELESADRFVRAAGGAPANVAVAAARLGARAGFAGAIGSDPFGRHLRVTLEDNGVDTSGLQTVRERTTLAFVARNAGGIPDFIFYRGADAAFSAEMLPVELIRRSTFVYVSSMALLTETSRAATLTAVMHAREARTLVAFDPNLRPSSWPSLGHARQAILGVLGRVDILKVNEEEALLLEDTRDVEVALRALSGTGRLVVVTRGADGCLWHWRNMSGSVPAPAVDVVDTTGAGDAFTGGLLAALCGRAYTADRLWALRRDDLEEMLRFACTAGALACTVPGAMPALPTRDQVQAALSVL
ncbi:MAG TPA: carbohydrate kinase [Chloroflexota bacterium]|nr:carbohydrate kinase [Chloroflexota bacterium]